MTFSARFCPRCSLNPAALGHTHVFVVLVEAHQLLLHQVDLLLRLLAAQPGVLLDLPEIVHVLFQHLPGLYLIVQPARKTAPTQRTSLGSDRIHARGVFPI